MVKADQPRGDCLGRPGGGVGGHPGTVPPSRQVPTEFARFAVGSLKRRIKHGERRSPNSRRFGAPWQDRRP
jgi:hypothetical protein